MKNKVSYSIAELGAPVLRSVAEAVEDVSSLQVQEFIDALLATCEQAQGMGIAATQVYKPWRIFIMAAKPNPRYPHAPDMEPTAIINPELIWQSDATEKDWEGCLSLPGIRAQVPRAKSIRVRYLTRSGEQVYAEFESFLARLFLHEFDHLNGKVFIDRVESTLDIVMEKEYQRIIREQR